MSTKLSTKYIPEKVNESFFTKKHIQVSEDGEHVFCQCSDSVTVVETKSGTVIRKISLEEDEVYCLALSPDGTSLTIGLNSSNVKHYKINDIVNNEPLLHSSFKSYHVGPVNCMSWDSTSTLLATGGSDGKARVWDLKQKFCTHSLKGAHGVISILLFDKDLRRRPWVFGAAGENIFVWLLEDGSSKMKGQLRGHDSTITGLQLGHSDNHLISCGLDKVIILWDLTNFTSKKIIPVFESLSGVILKPSDFQFYDICENSEDNIVFTIGNKGIPRIWNIDKGKELWKADEPISPLRENEQLFCHLSLVKATKSFVLTSYENVILFLHCKSMKVWKKLVGENDEILDVVCLGEENRRFTAVASNSVQIRVYENATNSCELVAGHTGNVFALANHPEDPWVFGSSSSDNTARLWRLLEDGSCECLAIASGHTHNVACLALARDFLITGSNDTCIKRWNFNLKELSSNTVNLSSSRTQSAHSKPLNSVAVSKTFKLIATSAGDKEAKIWDAKTLEQIGTLQGHRKGIWCVQFSPTDAIVATASADGTIKLWSLSTFSNIGSLEGHEVGVMRLKWISQGQQILSSGADGIVKLWTVKTSVCVASFDEHEGRLWALTTADGGRLMITGASDSKLIWWRDVSEEEQEKEMLEKKRLVEEEQILMNLLHEKKWSKALRYSLRLNQPFRGLTIMKALLDESPASLPPVLKGLRDEELHSLLEYVIQWNTKTINAREAQYVLNYVLKEKTPEELEVIPNWTSILERLVPYTEKHFKRISALHQSVSILDYITACMSIANMNLIDIDEKSLEEEETALLRTIPKNLKGTITIEDNKISEESSSESSEDESFEHDDDYNDLGQMNKDLPVESVDDIRANFVYERVMAKDDESDEEEEYGKQRNKERREIDNEEQTESSEENYDGSLNSS